MKPLFLESREVLKEHDKHGQHTRRHKYLLKEGKVSEVELNAPFGLIASKTKGSGTVLNGCRAWIRTRAKGSKVPRATTTQLGILSHKL